MTTDDRPHGAAPPVRAAPGPAGPARGFPTGGAGGTAVAGLVVGAAVLPALLAWSRHVRRARGPRCTALAVIENRQALNGDSRDVPVVFELGVAPDEGPAFRVRIRQSMDLTELVDHPVHRTVVVTYPRDRPWDARIVTGPSPEWARRAAEGTGGPAPDPPSRTGG